MVHVRVVHDLDDGLGPAVEVHYARGIKNAINGSFVTQALYALPGL